MADEITDDVSNPIEGQWYEPLVGDDSERAALFKDYESPDKFIEDYQGLKNRDWRDEFAGDDLKFKSTLERFKSPADFSNSYREAQAKIRSGQLRPEPPGTDATEDDIKAYREANNIPMEVKDYLESLPEGVVLGEDDLPIAESFMTALHESFAPPEVAHALIAKYNEFQEQQQELLAEADSTQHQETEDFLRKEWAGDYRANINMIGGLLESTFGKEAKEQLLNGRFQDGRGFMNDPKILEGLADIARKLNPIAALTKPGGDAEKTLNDEIAEIEKVMREKRHVYDKDEKMQARLRELYDIRLKHQAA